MAMSREQIYNNVRETLVDALAVEPDEVTEDATLTGDLGAESIDFLDIVFRLEKSFNIKIPRGELFPDDLLNNPVQPLPAPLRVGTVLALLWSELKETTPTLIPLPMALDWADRHAGEEQGRWRGAHLLEHMLNHVWRMLEQEFAHRAAGQAAPKP